MKVTSSAVLALVAAVKFAAAQDTPLQPPITPATNTGTPTSQGCFKGKSTKWDFFEKAGMSSGYCHGPSINGNPPGICLQSSKKYTVSALTPDGCYCGFEYPAKSDLVDDEKCNEPCQAWDKEACESDEHRPLDTTPD